MADEQDWYSPAESERKMHFAQDAAAAVESNVPGNDSAIDFRDVIRRAGHVNR